MALDRSPSRPSAPFTASISTVCLTTSVGLAVLLPQISLAQQGESTPPPPATSPDLGGSLLQLGFGFAAVLALLFASLWLLKRLSAPRGQAGGLMKVISSLAVGPRERVVLMEVGDQWLLVGVGPGHISKLGELPRQALPPATGNPAAPEFAAWLKRAIERRPGQGA